MSVTTTPTVEPEPSGTKAPAVLAVLVARDASDRIRDCLHSLAAQTYGRLGVIGIDDGSRDDTRELLTRSLGDGRVLSLEKASGMGAAMDAAMGLPVADSADYICLVHDDAVLDPDAITKLVDAALTPGAEKTGIVGPKVLDAEDPRLLRDVGRGADRFGHPSTPLQPGEIDQGQFDRMVEVLCVSSAAMLVSTSAWKAAGGFDPRIDLAHAELDLCWRMRMAGYRVVMTPAAQISHSTANPSEGRSGRHMSARYDEDRAALASMLKNYSVFSLVWLLPLFMLLTGFRLLFLTLSRRLDESFDVTSALAWNARQLPTTLKMRRSAQKARKVRDRQLHRFIASTGLRLPRWFQTAELIFEEQRGELDETGAERTFAKKTSSLLSTHPVLVASLLGTVVGALAIRSIWSAGVLSGGVLPAFPSTPGGFIAELISGFRSTGLGGGQAASPALGALAGLSTLLLGSTSLAQKVALAGLLPLAAILMYRAVVRLTGKPGSSVVASAAYSLSAVALWAFSQGRIDLLVVLAVMPAFVERADVAFSGQESADSRRRFIYGTAVSIAVAAAFIPGVLLPLALVVLVQLLTGKSRAKGSLLFAKALLGAALLLFPFCLAFFREGGAALGSYIGDRDFWALARSVLGSAPGSWGVSWFLPVAAALAFGIVGTDHRARATRYFICAGASICLAWLSSAGYLPVGLSNAPAYVVLSACCQAMIIGLGLSSILGRIRQEAFGLRQVSAVSLVLVMTLGIFAQSFAAMIGGWDFGPKSKVPAEWAVARSRESGDFRVLWVGSANGEPFLATGGDPTGVVVTPDVSVRWALTGKNGPTVLDTGRNLQGQGRVYLEKAINEILTGTTGHGGALLAPFGIRFVVAQVDDLPAEAKAALARQVDLAAQSSTMVAYRNEVALQPASALPKDALSIVSASDSAAISALRPMDTIPLDRVRTGWKANIDDPSVLFLSMEDPGSWKLSGKPGRGETAFGWATYFEASAGASKISNTQGWLRLAETWVLAAAWAVALWVTRKPVSR